MLFSAKTWLVPSIAAILFLAALPELFQASNGFLTDPATARHLRAGEIMLASGQVLTTDPFGCEVPPRPWLSFEWLFEVAVAALARAGGLPLAYAAGFLLFCLLPVLLWRLLIQQNTSLPVAFFYALAAGLVFRSHLLLRPLLLTYLLLIIVVAWWHRHRETPGLTGWLALPLVFALWANCHGGFTAALLFLALSFAGQLMDRHVNREPFWRSGTLQWFALIVVCANATLLTPHGAALHRMIWDMVFHIQSFAQWNEFRPPDFSRFTPLSFAVIFIAGVSLLTRSHPSAHRWPWEWALPVLAFLYFGVKVQRHVMLLLVVAAVPVCHDLDSWLNLILPPRLRQRLTEMGRFERENRSHLWIIPVVALFAVLFFLKTPAAATLRVGADNLSPQAVKFIRLHRSQFQHPLVTTWNAGALVYHLAPDFRVTFDDRTEFYGDTRLKPYIALLRCEPGWEKTLQTGGYDSAILDHDFDISRFLGQVPGWEKVYEDKLTIIYVRRP